MIHRVKDLFGISKPGVGGTSSDRLLEVGVVTPGALPSNGGSRTVTQDHAATAAGVSSSSPDRTVPPAPDYPLADAFEFLFASELGEAPASGVYGDGVDSLSDAAVDRIAARVVERLTQGPLRNTIIHVITDVSERLVREEIIRIRTAASPRS